MQRSRFGAFVVGAEHFDNVRFAISPSEARAMDPQQRLLLECCYSALHLAGLPQAVLNGSDTGVAVGIYTTEFREILESNGLLSRSVYTATGTSLSVASGRVSFALGLHGPCSTFETACSSSLVACHATARALQHE